MNKADKMFRSFQTVNFKVTGIFGIREKGEIVKAKLINTDQDSGVALLYFPSNRDEVGMFGFATKKDEFYFAKGPLYSNYGEFGA